MRVFPEPLSLAESPRGGTVEIVHILFDSVRRKYRELGLRRGIRARCEAMSPAGVKLKLEDGTTAVVDHDQARFVEIRVLADPAEHAEGEISSSASAA